VKQLKLSVRIGIIDNDKLRIARANVVLKLTFYRRRRSGSRCGRRNR